MTWILNNFNLCNHFIISYRSYYEQMHATHLLNSLYSYSHHCETSIKAIPSPVCPSICKELLGTGECIFMKYGKEKLKDPRNRPRVAQRVPGGLGSQISWHTAREGGEVSLTHRPALPPGMFLVFIFTRSWVDPRAMERSEGDMSLNNPVTQNKEVKILNVIYQLMH
jgi:hypothetical protein